MVLANELNLSVSIETANGWLDLEDEAGGYTVDATAFAERSVSHRKVESSSGWMEGTYVSRSVKENVNETVAVQVTGATASELKKRTNDLVAAFEQLSYQMIVSIDDDQEIWSCTVADYAITTSQAFMFSRMAIVKATVPHLPSLYQRVIVPGTKGYWVLGDQELSVLGRTTILL